MIFMYLIDFQTGCKDSIISELNNSTRQKI